VFLICHPYFLHSQNLNINRLDQLISMGDIAFVSGDYNNAIEYFSQALVIDPYNADLYFKRAEALANLGKYKQAIYDYTQAINIDPTFYRAYIQRGNAYYK